MSKYSGYKDVYDHYGKCTDDELKEMTFWVGENPTPLRIESQKDLAPYYPNLIKGEAVKKGHQLCRFSQEPIYAFPFEDESVKEAVMTKTYAYRWLLSCEMIRLGWNQGEAYHWTKLNDKWEEYADKLDKEIAKKTTIDEMIHASKELTEYVKNNDSKDTVIVMEVAE
jgi:hypothetical protein